MFFTCTISMFVFGFLIQRLLFYHEFPFNVDRSVSNILSTTVHVIFFFSIFFIRVSYGYKLITVTNNRNFHFCRFTVHIVEVTSVNNCVSVFTNFCSLCCFMDSRRYFHFLLCPKSRICYIWPSWFNVFQFKHKYQCLRLIPYFHLQNFNLLIYFIFTSL